MKPDDFSIDCTGDVVAGDTILFQESVFGGSYRKPKHLGSRQIIARIVRDSYGAAKQQHTFTLDVLWSDGVQPLSAGTRTTRKGRNVYGEFTLRMPWTDESQRHAAAEEKHARGDRARQQRRERLASNC